MKHLQLIALILSTLTLSAQEDTRNFKINDGKLMWQKVYQSPLKITEILTALQALDSISGESVRKLDDNTIIATLSKLPLDFRGYGKTEMSTPMYISRSVLNAKITIEVKDGRYRVTITGMTLTQRYDDGLIDMNEESDLASYALRKKNTEFKSAFLGDPSGIIDYTLTKHFTLTKKQSNDDNW